MEAEPARPEFMIDDVHYVPGENCCKVKYKKIGSKENRQWRDAYHTLTGQEWMCIATVARHQMFTVRSQEIRSE